MNKNTIELNGKRYDATTGALLGESVAVSTTPAKPHKRSGGRVIDGFIRPAAKSASIKTAATSQKAQVKQIVAKVKTELQPKVPKTAEKAEKKPLDTPAPIAAKAKPAKVHSPAPAHIIQPHQPQHAKTLMGRVSQKPAYSLKPAIKPQAPADVAMKPASPIEIKHFVASVDPDRVMRAQRIATHKSVSRFPKISGHTTTPLLEPLPPQTHVPIIPVKSAPLAGHHAHIPKPPADIFEAAIAHATSHTQPAHRVHRTRRRKILNLASGAAALLVIGAFFAFLNLSNIEVHVASIQAGFHAAVPSYTPTGYALVNGVKRTGNTVSMVFRSGENNYTLTQQPSDWNNEALLDNTLPLQSNHQTIQVGGRTIYIYDKSNAVWVTGNIRYDLTGNAPLTADTISRLAMSL